MTQEYIITGFTKKDAYYRSPLKDKAIGARLRRTKFFRHLGGDIFQGVFKIIEPEYPSFGFGNHVTLVSVRLRKVRPDE